MNASRRIYLDNAATSWPKPPAVYEAVDRYLRHNGAAAGRGTYRAALEAEQALARTRRTLAQLLGVAEPRRVIFTCNGTDSLNQGLHGLLRAGDHVVTTDAEHNSVLRPLRFAAQHRGVHVTQVPCDGQGRINPDDVRAALRRDTRLLAVTHASNVTGVIQPIEELMRLARDSSVLVLLDAAQTAGHLPIDCDKLGIDLLATSGHKGLLGPLGTGVLVLGPRVLGSLLPLRQGGTGTDSERDEQPETLPDRFESGNHNVPGIVGLEHGVAFVQERGLAKLRRHDVELLEHVKASLRELPGVALFGPPDATEQVGLVSLRLKGYDPQELATLLDAEYGIQVRSGLHCAPRLHQRLGTAQAGGTLRVSLGPFNTRADADDLLRALAEISTTGI